MAVSRGFAQICEPKGHLLFRFKDICIYTVIIYIYIYIHAQFIMHHSCIFFVPILRMSPDLPFILPFCPFFTREYHRTIFLFTLIDVQ